MLSWIYFLSKGAYGYLNLENEKASASI
uniref:Uncharacterized protein n=1 Tax=Rhizophora mucronata TaxID=61149 RepID=A0A2P2N9H4_RHIMU